MGKQSGLGDGLYVQGVDLSGDIQQLNKISTSQAVLNKTGINKSAIERIGGLRDGAIEMTTHFDRPLEHAVLSLLPSTDVQIIYARGTALGSSAAAMVAKQTSYDGTRSTDADFLFKVAAVANGYGLEWGVLATAGVRADTTATNGASIDLGTLVAAAGFGAQAYLQVFGFTGTSCTVKLQGSSDDGVGDAYADITGGTFGAQTAIGASRIATANNLTLERYLRVVTTGTFSACSFAVVVVPNLTATAF